MKPPCLYLGKQTGERLTPQGTDPEHACHFPQRFTTTLSNCETCQDWRDRKAKERDVRAKVSAQPLGPIFNRWDAQVDMGDLFLGSSAFLVLGGPSLKKLPLEKLAARGPLIFSVNNCPAALPPGVRPNVWLSVDGPQKFHDGIWRDASVMKFVPRSFWGCRCGEPKPVWQRKRGNGRLIVPKGIRTRNERGELEFIPNLAPMDCPNAWGYQRNAKFNPETFLTEVAINWGNDKQNAQSNGWPHTLDCMFASLRLAYYLGVRTLYLLGCDFRMDAAQPYAFEQGKDRAGISAHSGRWANLNVMLDALQSEFLKAGYRVYNCSPGSGCVAFPMKDFADALQEATAAIPQTLDARGWYDDFSNPG